MIPVASADGSKKSKLLFPYPLGRRLGSKVRFQVNFPHGKSCIEDN
jgi:hypothetical protein